MFMPVLTVFMRGKPTFTPRRGTLGSAVGRSVASTDGCCSTSQRSAGSKGGSEATVCPVVWCRLGVSHINIRCKSQIRPFRLVAKCRHKSSSGLSPLCELAKFPSQMQLCSVKVVVIHILSPNLCPNMGG